LSWLILLACIQPDLGPAVPRNPKADTADVARRFRTMKLYYNNVSTQDSAERKDWAIMGNDLRRWLSQVWTDVKKKQYWVFLGIAFILDQLCELLKHRLYAAINDWLDAHTGVIMDFCKPVLLWFLDTPFVLLAAVVCSILVHAYWVIRRGEPDQLIDRPGESPRAPSAIVEPKQPISTDDPAIIVEFLDERKDQLYKKTALLLMNTGGREALDVRIKTISLRGQEIRFPHVAGAIASHNHERFDPQTDGTWGTVNTALFVDALIKEWNSYNDVSMKELPIPVKVTYQNFSRTAKFETTCILVFNPFQERLNRTARANHKDPIHFRDFDHRKFLL
jgi:hypothetical protein